MVLPEALVKLSPFITRNINVLTSEVLQSWMINVCMYFAQTVFMKHAVALVLD